MSGEKIKCRCLDPQKFFWNHDDRLRVVRGPWMLKSRSKRTIFVAYKIIVALLLSLVTFWSALATWHGGKWLIFLTHWNLTVLWFETVISAVLAVKDHKKWDSFSAPGKKLPLSYKIYWTSYNVAITMAFFITITYWLLVHDPKTEEPMDLLIINVLSHVFNSVVATMEFLIAGPPSRLAHFWQPLAFGFAFAFFTAIFWSFEGTNPKGEPFVYSVMNWYKPWNTLILIVSSILLIIFLHAFCTLMDELRNRCMKRIYERDNYNMSFDCEQAPVSTKLMCEN